MLKSLKNTGVQIASAFLAAILIGTILLYLPISTYPGKHLTLLESLFEATSAVCVTGLIVVDTGTTFTVFGKIVLALLIQLGGLGIAIAGIAVAILFGHAIKLHERSLMKESWNLSSFGGTHRILRQVLLITFIVQGAGALLTFPIFLKSYPFWTALGYSIFHGISAFNNAGFDLIGNGIGLTGYADHLAMNIITCSIIIIAGLGFLVIRDILTNRKWKKFTLQTRIVLFMTALLVFGGMLLLRLTDKYTWLECFFQSVTARTAGFNTVDLGQMSQAGMFVMVLLMICGASPGSTGGGIKTTTVFTLMLALLAAAHNSPPHVFKRKLASNVIHKAFTVTMAFVTVLLCSTFIICVLQPQFTFMQVLFEVTSALNTVGVSTGITAQLCTASRCVIICTMFIGRVGPLAFATMWANPTPPSYTYSEESIMIG